MKKLLFVMLTIIAFSCYLSARAPYGNITKDKINAYVTHFGVPPTEVEEVLGVCVDGWRLIKDQPREFLVIKYLERSDNILKKCMSIVEKARFHAFLNNEMTVYQMIQKVETRCAPCPSCE